MSLLDLAIYASESDEEDDANGASPGLNIDTFSALPGVSVEMPVAASSLLFTSSSSSVPSSSSPVERAVDVIQPSTHRLLNALPPLLETAPTSSTAVKLKDYFDARDIDGFDLTEVSLCT